MKIQRHKNVFVRKPKKIKKNQLAITRKSKKREDETNTGSRKQYSQMSVDDFLMKGLEESSTESENDDGSEEVVAHSEEDINNQLNDDQLDMNKGDEFLDVNMEDEFASHKKSLDKLKDTDPEFYKFLQDNDKQLLNFDLSDSDSEGSKREELDDDVHRPLGELEVASDESDFEDATKNADDTKVTLKMLKSWQTQIQTDKSNCTIVNLIRAFHAAILRVSNKDSDEASNFKVEGSSVFNGVIQICVLELGPALRRYLRIPVGSKQPPHKSKKFVKIKATLKGYFVDLLKLLTGVTSTNILNVLLKHLHYMSPMVVSYGSVLKQLLKKLVHLWGTAEETVRVIAFLCILRLVNSPYHNNLDMVLKSMYMTYVQNSKFVSPTTLPMINFMRRSLVEMFALDLNASYQHVFLYIRQLAIHLRNAITVKKKENIQAVYNWQYVNSLRLWGNLLSVTCAEKSPMQPLVYPFVQVCIGTINLIPTAQYYPLRFHIIQVLIDLSNAINVFIPVLPFLLEVLTTYNFNKKHQKISMKPLQFLCILRLSKSQLMENGFKDAVVDVIYGQLLEYLSLQSHSIAFPDMSLSCIIQLKAFLKKCSVAAYCRKMRQVLEKIEQNNKFITNERRNVTFNLTDTKQVEAWETTLKNKGTPLYTYYQSWNAMKNVKRNKEATKNDTIGDYNLPVLKKISKRKQEESENNGRRKSEELKDNVELFPSDSESENEINAASVAKKIKRGKRGGRNVNKKPSITTLDAGNDDDVADIVEDLKASDW